jgi:hypothetical protein
MNKIIYQVKTTALPEQTGIPERDAHRQHRAGVWRVLLLRRPRPRFATSRDKSCHLRSMCGSRRLRSEAGMTRRTVMRNMAHARERRNVRLRVAALLMPMPAADRARILSDLLAETAPKEGARLGVPLAMPDGGLFFPAVSP